MAETDNPVIGVAIADIVSNRFQAGVTYRRYGMNGELRRPMIHRFPASKLKCAGSVANTIVAENVARSNALFAALVSKGKSSDGRSGGVILTVPCSYAECAALTEKQHGRD